MFISSSRIHIGESYTLQVDVEVMSPEAGTLTEQFAKPGETVQVGSDLFKLKLGDSGMSIFASL